MYNIYKDSIVINISIIDPRATVNTINGNPILSHLVKLILCPYFIEIPAATTPALEPIKVPLPPRSAPNAKAHQRGLIFKLPKREVILLLVFRVSMIGTIVAVKGILSINALAIADNQIIA
jgi:hypothetical protein